MLAKEGKDKVETIQNKFTSAESALKDTLENTEGKWY